MLPSSSWLDYSQLGVAYDRCWQLTLMTKNISEWSALHCEEKRGT